MTPLDWPTIESELPALIAGVLGLDLLADDSAPVYWQDAARPPWVPDVTAYLTTIAESTTGTHEQRWTQAPALGEGLEVGGEPAALLETIATVERLTIRVRVESMSHNDTARSYIARLRTAIFFTDVFEALDALGLGLEDCGDVQEPSQTYDERLRSIAQCDLRFNAIASTTSTTRTPTLERVSFNMRGVR